VCVCVRAWRGVAWLCVCAVRVRRADHVLARAVHMGAGVRALKVRRGMKKDRESREGRNSKGNKRRRMRILLASHVLKGPFCV
jgi:hypothetical protein